MSTTFPPRGAVLVALAVILGTPGPARAQPLGAGDLLEEVRQRIVVADQHATVEARAAVWRAALAFPLSPREAFRIVAKARDAIRDNPDISERCRTWIDEGLSVLLPDDPPAAPEPPGK